MATEYFAFGEQTLVSFVRCANGTVDLPPSAVQSCHGAGTLIHPSALTTGCSSGVQGRRTGCAEVPKIVHVVGLLAASNGRRRAAMGIKQNVLDCRTGQLVVVVRVFRASCDTR